MIAAIAVDLETSPLGTASRLERLLGGKTVLCRTVERIARVETIDRVVLMAAAGQEERVRGIASAGGSLEKVVVQTLIRRQPAIEARVRVARAWGLSAWRGGAGQWTVFDEDYHPQSVWAAVREFGDGQAGDVLVLAAHAGLADTGLLAGLVEHHRRNKEMRLTYSAAAPGLCGMILQGSIAGEMAQANVLPGQLLAYDPKAPTFDTLIRDACMQVDPALSKVPNRFLLDTDRAWAVAERLVGDEGDQKGRQFSSAAEMALAARTIRNEISRQPMELEIELTGQRLTNAPGEAPEAVRLGRGEMDAGHWTRWLGGGGGQRFTDDLVMTFAGDGDPLLYEELVAVLRAARQGADGARAQNIHVQTDLLAGPEEIGRLWAALEEGLVDVVSVRFYGDSAETYRRVAGVDGYGRVMGNMEELLRRAAAGGDGRSVLVVPRLLKVRETIPEMEAFFDKWILHPGVGWAVMDGPTDKAGEVPFTAVVDMAPPKRRACRRLAAGEGRMLIRANGQAVACDQDVRDTLRLGHIESASLEAMWVGENMRRLRVLHEEGKWAECGVCARCREWHRP